MRTLVRLAFVVAAAALPAAGLAGNPKPPILYVSGVECPAHIDCVGQKAYNGRIQAIPKPGLPSLPVSSGLFNDLHPVWSPNYKQIAFSRFAPNGSAYHIWIMNADGSGATQVTHGSVDTEPAWSPDGTKLVFRGNSPDGQTFDIFTVNVNGTGLTDLTNNPDSISAVQPDWSPNGRLIVFDRTNQNLGLGTGLYTISPAGTGLKKLTAGGQQPRWSPNGKRLAAVFTDSSDDFQIFTLNANGSGKVQLTHGSECVDPAWSPDGTQIVFTDDGQIALINANGTGIKQLTKKAKGLNFVNEPDW
jgi:Tol biopolymer transport system component